MRLGSPPNRIIIRQTIVARARAYVRRLAQRAAFRVILTRGFGNFEEGG